MAVNLNGAKVFYPDKKEHGIFVALPKEAWQSAGRCNCPVCKGGEGFWDTLAIPPKGKGTAYTVHYPALQTRFPR